jgi:hypothetical protein
MSASYPTRVFLAFKSGGRCAFKDCQKALTSDGQNSNPAIIGEAAHIYGESPGTKTKLASARYRDDMTDEQRNHYNNLIYLCPTCHTKIDKQEKDYPAERLFALKAGLPEMSRVKSWLLLVREAFSPHILKVFPSKERLGQS